MTLQGITEEDIANYLINTPGFFERQAQIMGAIQLTSPHGQRAVSLQERQMEMLRDKIKGLERRLMDMIRFGQENEAIAERLHRWVRSVMLCHADAQLADTLIDRLKYEFMVPQAAVRMWDTDKQTVRADLAYLDACQTVSADVRSFAASLSQPYCGLNNGFEAAKWLEDPNATASMALIPLHHGGATFGLLVLASPDPTRYSNEMGLTFLDLLGNLTAAALSRYLA
ncbi:MAG: hypothetical protein RI907_2475 [Pseudomonadota bacterium]|jgi:uncharacterized protein YigA (DUF484 family)